MKKGLMTQFPFARGREFVCKNIGDYIQSIAASQYIDKIDEFIEQEEANDYYPEDKKKIKLIMNGWFQWRAENFPPSEYIEPLLVSLHISPLRQKWLLTKEGIAFFKRFSPVGCRDYYTKNLLESVGVPAYFSACLTLTLDKKYYISRDERKEIYFVDPYFDVPELVIEQNGKKKFNYKIVLKSIFCYLRNIRIINKLAKNSFFADYSPVGFLDKNRKAYRPYYKATLFYLTYSKKVSNEVMLDAKYITHWLDVDMKKTKNTDLLCIAEGLVKKYAAAKLMITSRIHAGLPGLGLETPVVFVANEEVVSENGRFNTPGRLDGLLQLFRVLQVDRKGIFTTDDEVLKKIDIIQKNTLFENKYDYKEYAEKLQNQCEIFMKEDISKMNEIERIKLRGGWLTERWWTEEIREGEFISAELKKIWALEMDLYREFARVCEKYKLRYFTDGGTTLGAVRHRGFIPWDDDMDVCMPRADYEKLKLLADEFKEPYFFQTPETDSQYGYSYAKLRNSNTAVYTRSFAHAGFNMGFFLDIFPLDKITPEDYVERRNQINRLVYINSAYMRKNNPNKNEHDMWMLNNYYNPNKTPLEVWREIENIATLDEEKETEYWSLIVSTLYKAENKIWPRYIFKDYIEMPFESITVRVPKGYDEQLKIYFGNYMEFPPKEKRGTWHDIEFYPDIPYKLLYKEKFGVDY